MYGKQAMDDHENSVVHKKYIIIWLDAQKVYMNENYTNTFLYSQTCQTVPFRSSFYDFSLLLQYYYRSDNTAIFRSFTTVVYAC